MAFSDDFTGSNGQALSARTGWTLLRGDDLFNVQSNRISRTGSYAGAIGYGVGVGGTTQHAGWDFETATHGNYVGPCIFMSLDGGGKLQCYQLRVQTGAGSARIYRHLADGLTYGGTSTQVNGTTITISGDDTLELRGTVVGADVSLEVWQAGALLAGPWTDSTAPLTTGHTGIASFVNATFNPAGDNFTSNYTAAAPPATARGLGGPSLMGVG